MIVEDSDVQHCGATGGVFVTDVFASDKKGHTSQYSASPKPPSNGPNSIGYGHMGTNDGECVVS